MWDLPGPGLEPVSPALAGRFSTTAPPGKPQGLIFDYSCLITLPLLCSTVSRESITLEEEFCEDKTKIAWLRNMTVVAHYFIQATES